MVDVREDVALVGDVALALVRGGSGRPLLMLHDELGFPGWMSWNDMLASGRELIVPLQPGFGRTEKLEWVTSYRDLAAFYNRFVREQGWAPVDIIGFSAGGFIAAEMLACAPELFGSTVLVAPLGCRPVVGEIFDFFAVTVSAHVAATVHCSDAPEFAKIYGGQMTPDHFQAFQDARGETARLGWEPFMFDPGLPHRLAGSGEVPVLIVRGEDDLIVPRGCVDAYLDALPHAESLSIPGVGHRPEIEAPDVFVGAVKNFLRY